MIKMDAKDYGKHPVLNTVHDAIIQNHQFPDDTVKLLKDNKHVKGFAEAVRVFREIIAGGQRFYISYDALNYLDGKKLVVKLQYIVLYDNYLEWEVEKTIQEHQHKAKLN